MSAEYYAGSDLPDLAVTWLDDLGIVIPFASGWTFTARIGRRGRPILVTKTTGFTGSDTAPNLTLAWAEGELGALDPGAYVLQITATRVDGKKRNMQTLL